MLLPSENREPLEPESARPKAGLPNRLLPAGIPFAVGVLGRLPALGSFWNQDDWGLLGRAAGLMAESDLPARLASQVWYWRLMYPLFGVAPDPYAWTRLFLHGGCAALVARIAAHGGLSPLSQLTAGLLFAITPLAFTPLYWASGIQEIMAAFFALFAIERWLAGGRTGRLIAVALATIAILAKENALGLPIVFAILLWGEKRRSPAPSQRAWAAVLWLGLVAIVETILVWRHFLSAAGQPYALGAWYQPLDSLSFYGWWMLSPGPVFAFQFNSWMSLTGWALFALWGAWAVWNWRRGSRWPAACGAGALLALAPALPLDTHAYPYLAYLAAAGGVLALAGLVRRRWRLRPGPVLVAAALLAAWSWWGMSHRLKIRDAQGLPADPLVLRTAVSYRAIKTLQSVPAAPGQPRPQRLILLQPYPTGDAADLARQLGERWVAGTLVFNALEGTLGPRLSLGAETEIAWANNLLHADPEAFVLADGGAYLRPWGRTPQALLYLCLTEVARGHFDRARSHLLKTALISGRTMPFIFDRDLMIASVQQVQKNAAAFMEFLAPNRPDGSILKENQALRDIFSGLLEAVLQPAPELKTD